MKGLIVLSHKEAHRGHVLEQVAQRALTLKEAAKIMGISYRQAKRVHKRWQQDAKGPAGEPVSYPAGPARPASSSTLPVPACSSETTRSISAGS